MTPTQLAAQATDVRGLGFALMGPVTEAVDDTWSRAIGASPDAWEVFLRSERCAAPMAQWLERADRLDDLPAQVGHLLQGRRQREAMRTLRGRIQLAETGRVAAARGWPVIVLKGGRALVGSAGTPVDLADLDILVPATLVDEVTTWLDSHSVARGRYTSARHVASRYVDAGLPVEVHRTTELDGTPTPQAVWERAIPLAGGLLGLEPLEHAWFLLHHATTTHVSRRGRVRDVILLADALQPCSGTEKRELYRRTTESCFAEPLRRNLDMAAALASREVVPDRYRSAAFTRYVMYEVMRRVGRRRVLLEAPQLVEWVFAINAGRAERRALWGRALTRSIGGPSTYRIISFVEERSPRLGLLWRRALRLAHRAFLYAVAWPLAQWITWAWQGSHTGGGAPAVDQPA